MGPFIPGTYTFDGSLAVVCGVGMLLCVLYFVIEPIALSIFGKTNE